MIEFSGYTNEHLKAVLTFDNGKTYTCLSSNTEEQGNILVRASGNFKDSFDDGNPLGIIVSNEFSLSIRDKEDNLVSTNIKSPYYKYMRNGVKVELYLIKNGAEKPYGVYYTNSWDSKRASGYYETTDLSCTDSLNYIGNKEIPELPAFSGITIQDLLINIFSALNITNYIIDPSLNLDLVFSVKQGDRLRDVLNDIAQALIARVTCDMTGKIMIVPAFPEKVVYGKVSDRFIDKATIGHNTNNQYNRVRLDYTDVGIQESVNLASLQNKVIPPGEFTIDGIQLTNDVQGIDQVNITQDVTPTTFEEAVEVKDYKGYQGGVTVYIENKGLEAKTVGIDIEGRVSSVTNASVYSDVADNDVKIASTLILESKYIQGSEAAQSYVNKVAEYLRLSQHSYTSDSHIEPSMPSGVYIQIESNDPVIAGVYYISGVSPNFNEGNYSMSISYVKCA